MWLCRRRNKQNLFGDFGQLPRRTPRGGSIDGAHAAHRAARSPSKTEILYDSPDRGALRVWRLYLRTVGLGAAPTAGAVGSAALSPSPRSGEALKFRQRRKERGVRVARSWLLVLLATDPRPARSKKP